MHGKRGLLTAKMRLYEAVFIAHFCANRHTPHIVRHLRLHAQNSQKTHGRFSDGFFASFERQEHANIVSQTLKEPPQQQNNNAMPTMLCQQCAPKGQHSIAQGNALGISVLATLRPVRATLSEHFCPYYYICTRKEDSKNLFHFIKSC